MIEPSESFDAVPSKLHDNPVQVGVNCATGGTLPAPEFGTSTFFENSEVLPFGFVAVAVTGFPLADAGNEIVAWPPPFAVPDARYVIPEPNAPADCDDRNTSTTQLPHVVAVMFVGVAFESVGAIMP